MKSERQFAGMPQGKKIFRNAVWAERIARAPKAFGGQGGSLHQFFNRRRDRAIDNYLHEVYSKSPEFQNASSQDKGQRMGMGADAIRQEIERMESANLLRRHAGHRINSQSVRGALYGIAAYALYKTDATRSKLDDVYNSVANFLNHAYSGTLDYLVASTTPIPGRIAIDLAILTTFSLLAIRSAVNLVQYSRKRNKEMVGVLNTVAMDALKGPLPQSGGSTPSQGGSNNGGSGGASPPAPSSPAPSAAQPSDAGSPTIENGSLGSALPSDLATGGPDEKDILRSRGSPN